MNIFIVYCHPGADSFTFQVKEAFIRGLVAAGHSFAVSDLYEMGFNAWFSEQEYRREAFYDESAPLSSDILAEQAKIDTADAIVFIYPDFWTEAPALLVGWFQRVLTYGYAYGNRTMKRLEKALFMVTMGGSLREQIRVEQVEAMKKVMIGDRMNGRWWRRHAAPQSALLRQVPDRNLPADQYHGSKYEFPALRCETTFRVHTCILTPVFYRCCSINHALCVD